MIDPVALWIVIVFLGLGSFALRFVFIGFIGDRPLPAWLLRHLRYTAVAVLPGLVAPLVMWPEATGGAPDAPRLLAALTTLGIGVTTRNVTFAVLAGAAVLLIGLQFTG